MSCEPELLSDKTKPAKTRKLDSPPGVPPLRSLYMYISGSRILACRHCWIKPDYQADNKNGKFIKLDFVKKALKEAKPLGLGSAKLTGVEPMLHPQFHELTPLIEKEKLKMIKENKSPQFIYGAWIMRNLTFKNICINVYWRAFFNFISKYKEVTVENV